jgi:hypothetical protein
MIASGADTDDGWRAKRPIRGGLEAAARFLFEAAAAAAPTP